MSRVYGHQMPSKGLWPIQTRIASVAPTIVVSIGTSASEWPSGGATILISCEMALRSSRSNHLHNLGTFRLGENSPISMADMDFGETANGTRLSQESHKKRTNFRFICYRITAKSLISADVTLVIRVRITKMGYLINSIPCANRRHNFVVRSVCKFLGVFGCCLNSI